LSSPVVTASSAFSGMPIEVCEYTPALSSAGDIMLCDLSQYLLAEREPGVDSSIHVQFSTDETAFRFRFRTDGQPAGRSPVTPKNSSTTQSPFVALGAR
jgi:HK97 family phage major capsid protein